MTIPPTPLLVMKFGGTSVGSAKAIANVVEITRNARTEYPGVVIVTSAMSGVTNLLLAGADAAARGDMPAVHHAATEMRDKHYNAARAIIPDPGFAMQLQAEIETLISTFVSLCQAVGVLGEATPRAMDAIASLGERMSIRLLSAALNANGVPAQAVESSQLVVTDDRFQDALPDFAATTDRTRAGLFPLLERGVVPVVTGFIGATPTGITTTLGRGGSDYSAAILGAVLPAQDVWIWTDVDGVMSADPRLVPDARTISSLTFREIGELAYFGAKVLHPKTIRPVIEAGVGLRVCNTFNPTHAGTRIVLNGDSSGTLKAVTAIRGQKMVTVEGRGMLGVPGVAARTFQAVAETGTSVILITQASSEQSISFCIPASSVERVIAALERAFAAELARRDIDRIWATDENVIVTVVGAGLQYTSGIAGRLFMSLGAIGVNILAIAQGSSEAAISMVLAAEDTETAVRAIHGLIIERG
ncbi:MAG: aspartate kinase [Anaerolineales bacterium]|nr:aspartate kinase [Anaerolineales bacterium]